MSQPKSRFTEVEARRLIRAALDAGLKVTEIRLGPDGLSVVTESPNVEEHSDDKALRRVRELYSDD